MVEFETLRRFGLSALGLPSPEELERSIGVKGVLVPVKSEVGVGFFSNLLRSGAKILGSVLGFGGPAVARPTVATGLQRIGAGARRAGALVAAGATFGAGDVGIQALLSGPSGGVQIPGQEGTAGGGNGRSVRQTIVVTRDSMTGVILRTEVLRGAPFLMGRDVQIANRVFRQSTRLQRRLPKKIIRQSQRSALVNRVVSSALERAACPPDK